MDKKTQDIALNWVANIQAHDEVEQFYKQAEELGFTGIPQIIEEFAHAKNERDKANELFWETFKYPIQIFDLNKGEKPNESEIVFGYNEDNKDWQTVMYSVEVNKFCRLYISPQTFHLQEMHRWTRLPELETE